jgi:gamma-glutamylcyclotransferase (GGCT)/AIG2-like uncharacterized protein YtfP
MFEPVKVFVYGTLKRGYHNHRILGDSKFLSEATTKPLYKLYDCGSYPCITFDEKDGRAIKGELFEVSSSDILMNLDWLEAVPDLYRRDKIQLADDTEAIGYIFNRSTAKFKDCGTEWPRRATGG